MAACTPTDGSQPQAGQAWVTRKEAAALCAVHVDTIRRYVDDGRLPRSRKNAKGVVEVPVADLVAAGLLDPMASGDNVAEVATRSRAERDLIAARQELAVVTARFDAAVVRAERAEADVAWLRARIETMEKAS